MTQTLESVQQDNYNETFSNLINNMSTSNSFNLVDNLSRSTISSNSASIDSFINSSLDKNEEDKIIEFLFSIENNSNIEINFDSPLNDVLAYKTLIIDKKFEKLNNKLNSYLSVKENSKFLQETILNKINNLNKIVELISVGITEKTDRVVSNSFENILKRDIFSNQSKYFNKVTNYFFENCNQSENQSFLDINVQDITITSRNNTSQESLIDISSNNLMSKSLIEIERDYPFRFVKPIKNTSNDIVVQSIINSARSLFTISSNALLNNYIDNESLAIDFDRISLRNLISERNNLNIFKNLNINANFTNSLNIAASESLEFIPYENELNNEILKFSSEELFFEYIDDQDIRDHDPQLIGESELTFHNFLKEVNNYYSGSIFHIDLTNFNSSYDRLYEDYYIHIIDTLNIGSTTNSDYNSSLSSDYANSDSSFSVFLHNTNSDNNFSKIYFKDKPYNNINFGNTLNNSIQHKSSILNTFSVDEDTNLNNLFVKLKIDSFVKNIKNKYLINNGVNIDFLKKVFDKVKKKTNQEKLEILSYTKKDRKNIAAIDKDNDIFNVLFTEDNNNLYSNTDIISNHSVDGDKYLGIDNLKKLNIDINPLRENAKNNIKNLLSFYYPKCSLFSSSSFFSTVMSDIYSENEIEGGEVSNLNKIMTTQALYLNCFKNNTIQEKNKKIVLKRFFKAALMKDRNTIQSVRDSKPTDYLYDFEKYDITDSKYDIKSKESIVRYLDDILNSSENLKSIKKSVFSTKNIQNISDQIDYKLFMFFNIINRGRNRLVSFSRTNEEIFTQAGDADRGDVSYTGFKDENKIYLTGKVYNVIFPFEMMEYYYIISDEVKSKLNKKFERIEKNGIEKYLKNSGVYQDSEATSNEEYSENDYLYRPSNKGLDITSSDKIKLRFNVKFNDMIELRENAVFSNDNVNFPYFEIEDYFNEAVENENLIFHRICKIIQESIRLYSINYNNIFFDSEEKIDSFISENESFLFYIQQIIEIYAEFYIPYFNRIQRTFAMEFYKSYITLTSDYANNPNITNSTAETRSEYLLNRYSKEGVAALASISTLINQDFNFESSVIEGLDNRQSSLNGSIFGTEYRYKTPCEDFRKYSYFNNNLKQDLFNQNISQLEFDESPYTKFSNEIQNIAKSLYLSDIIQAFNFDILNGCLDYQDDIVLKTRQELSSSSAFNQLSNILPSPEVEKIEDNFYDIFYINCLSKNLFKSIYINKKIENRVKQGIEENQNFFKNPDIFKEVKDMEKLELSSTFNFSGSPEVLENYLASSFYMFGLKKSQLENIRYDSLIRVTVKLVDKFNLNHVYVPKTFLFSPLYTDMPTLLPEDLNNISNANSLGYYRLNNNINNRLGVVDSSSLKQSTINTVDLNQIFNANYQYDFMYENIKNKFQTTDMQTAQVYEKLIDNHMNSRKNSQLISTLYSIENINKKPMNNDSRILDNISSLSSKEFFNIFDIKKESSIINGNTSRESLFNATSNKDITYEFVNYLSSIGSYEEIYNSEYYEIYSIAVNPKDYYFVDLSNTENIFNFNSSIQRNYTPTVEENTNSFNFIEGKYYFKLKNKLENLNISVKVEII